jgi:hypothetical protein
VAWNRFGAYGLLSRRTLAVTPATTFYTLDLEGNVCQRLDANQTVLSSDQYDAYGHRVQGGGAAGDPFGGSSGYWP